MLVGDYLRRGVAEFIGPFAGGAAIVYNWRYLRPETEPPLEYLGSFDA